MKEDIRILEIFQVSRLDSWIVVLFNEMKNEGWVSICFLRYLSDNHAVSMNVPIFISYNNKKGQKLRKDLTGYTNLGVINGIRSHRFK